MPNKCPDAAFPHIFPTHSVHNSPHTSSPTPLGQVAEGRAQQAEASIGREVELRLTAACSNRALWPLPIREEVRVCVGGGGIRWGKACVSDSCGAEV